jgi:hypothetical protein
MTAARRLGFIAVLCMSARVAHADETFRCGKWVITSEATLGELVDKCGPPASRESRTEDVRVRNPHSGLMMTTGQKTIETLTWNRGARAAPMVVTVVDGAIKSIERKP